jgi:hypothetical protein
MLRRVLFAFVGIAVAAFLCVDRAPTVSAADPDVAGNWMLTYTPRAGMDQVFAIIKVEVKDGKPVASVLFVPFKGAKIEVTKFETSGKTVKFDTSVGPSFEGTLDKDGKLALGSFGPEHFCLRAQLSRTDKTELTANELAIRTDVPAPAAEAQKLASAVMVLRNKARLEKDADKKKELLDQAEEAQKEADLKAPGLLRDVVAKHGETPFALDAAQDLLRDGTRFKLTADEVSKLLNLIEKQSAQFGSRFAQFQMLTAIETIGQQKGFEGAVETAAAKLAKTPDAPTEFLSRVLTVRKAALEALGKTNDAKTLAVEIAKLEEQLDTDYIKKVPPFKPAAYPGRNDTSANQVVVMELFTGAQCPPCVAADVAFDALTKSYKPTELILIQYHMHIPGPDPLTNPSSVARWDYYREEFPNDIRGTPTTLFNGKPKAGGGGGMTDAESKYTEFTGIINPMLEKSSKTKVTGKAKRAGDKIDIAVEVADGNGDDMKLRLLVVEESVKYVGGNRLRFHHHVVRAMPGGAEGVVIKDKAFKHTATADFANVKKELTKYLDDYAADVRPFPKPDRPMDMKAVKVLALVQNDKTKEIIQAVQIEVEGKTVGGGE